MNFKTIQNIFIVVFFLLNLFLFGVYQESQTKYDTNDNQTKSSIEYRLKKDDIQTPVLNAKRQKGYYLSAKKKELLADFKALNVKEITESSSHEIKGIPANLIYLDREINSQKVQALLKKNNIVYQPNSYTYLSNLSAINKKSAHLVFGQSFKGLPFLDDNNNTILDLNATDNFYKLTNISQNFLYDIKPLREVQETISEKEAVIALYNNSRISEKSNISWLTLGYTKILEFESENVYVPTWLIQVQTNKTHKLEKVNAITGSIITETTVTKIDSTNAF
jgi:regulatory protein YycI of two-component signal transduction system YycFG